MVVVCGWTICGQTGVPDTCTNANTNTHSHISHMEMRERESENFADDLMVRQ